MKTQEAITQLKKIKKLTFCTKDIKTPLLSGVQIEAIDKAIEELSRPSQRIDFVCPYCLEKGCNGLDCDKYSEAMADVADKAFDVNNSLDDFTNKFLQIQIPSAVAILKKAGLKVLPLYHRGALDHTRKTVDEMKGLFGKRDTRITQGQLNEWATLNCSGIGVDGNIYRYISKDNWVPERADVKSIFAINVEKNVKVNITSDELGEPDPKFDDMTMCYGCGMGILYPVHIEGHDYCSENCFKIGYTKSPLA